MKGVSGSLKLGAATGFLLATIYAVFYLLQVSHFNLLALLYLPFALILGIFPATAIGAITALLTELIINLAGRVETVKNHFYFKTGIALLPGLIIITVVTGFYLERVLYFGNHFGGYVDFIGGFIPFYIYGVATMWMGWHLNREAGKTGQSKRNLEPGI